MNKKYDTRAKRTKNKLKNALNQLIEIKSFHSITVHEVSNLAGVNRSTFYIHYNSIYYLLGDCLLSGWSYKSKVNSLDSEEDVLNDIKQNIEATLRHFQKKRKLALVALEEMNSTPYMIWVRDILFAHLITWQKNFTKQLDEKKVTIINEFIINGVIGLYIWWLKNNISDTDESFIEQCSTMIMTIYSHFHFE